MKHKLFAILFLFLTINLKAQNNDSLVLSKIFKEALKKGEAYTMLDSLANGIGGRLSGSIQAQKAVEWGYRTMVNYGFDSVWLQPVMVPHWVRGSKEECYLKITQKSHFYREKLNICALGGSIATPILGITAKVIVVDSISDLVKLGRDKIEGNIVLFNRPMDESQVGTFTAYGGAVDQRWAGPSIAASYGAVATLCRSMEVGLSHYPHTGSMRYTDSLPKIPCAAIATIDADELAKQCKLHPDAEVTIKMSCETLPDELSYNVIGEIKGSKYPNEIVVFGGHLDSWDNGDGAHDDGAGCVQSIEVLRLIKALNLRPERTTRAVLFMNEENGLRGGKKYAELALMNKEKHIAAIESDEGGFTPRGFGLTADSLKFKKFQTWAPLFYPYHIYEFLPHGGGADIGPLREQGVPVLDYKPDSQRYFDFHHTEIDTFQHVNKRELHMGAAALASLVWLIANNGW